MQKMTYFFTCKCKKERKNLDIQNRAKPPTHIAKNGEIFLNDEAESDNA